MSNSIHSNVVTSLDSELADSVVRLIPERSRILCRMIRFLLSNPLASSSELSSVIGNRYLKVHANRINGILNQHGFGVACCIPPVFSEDQWNRNRHQWSVFEFNDQSASIHAGELK